MRKKPKALILAFKNLYLNSTDEAFYKAISQVFDIVFYGPGYTPLNELLTDSLKIYEKYGPFDACFIHQYVMHNLHSFPKFLEIDSVNQYFYFDRKYFCNSFSTFGDGYNKIPCLKFLISLRTDCYAFTQKEEEEYATFDGYLIIPPPEVISPVSVQVDFKKENFGIESTDRYINFCKDNKHRIIPVAHLISSVEFKYIPLYNKKYLVSVPGIHYCERKNAYDNLINANYNPVHQTDLANFFRRLAPIINGRFGLRLEATIAGINFIKWSFKSLIAQSRISFTDGSRVRAPIRKYFEIPAYSSLLAAEKPYNAEALGFISGSNFIECDSKTILDVVEYSLKNEDWTKIIIDNSQEFVKSKHSDLAWGGYLKNIYDKILCSSFKGCKWVNGTIEYR